MAEQIVGLAPSQTRYHVYGMALSFWTPVVTDTPDAPTVQYQPGCAVASIANNIIELQLEYARYDFLANQRGGLHVWEGPGGVFFEAWLPDTAFAGAVYRAIRAGQIRHVCCAGAVHATFPYTATVTNVTAYQMLTINLLLPESTPHLPDAFVTADEGEFRRRVGARAERSRRWMAGKLQAAGA